MPEKMQIEINAKINKRSSLTEILKEAIALLNQHMPKNDEFAVTVLEGSVTIVLTLPQEVPF